MKQDLHTETTVAEVIAQLGRLIGQAGQAPTSY
jgi:hypothetical protein